MGMKTLIITGSSLPLYYQKSDTMISFTAVILSLSMGLEIPRGDKIGRLISEVRLLKSSREFPNRLYTLQDSKVCTSLLDMFK